MTRAHMIINERFAIIIVSRFGGENNRRRCISIFHSSATKMFNGNDFNFTPEKQQQSSAWHIIQEKVGCVNFSQIQFFHVFYPVFVVCRSLVDIGYNIIFYMIVLRKIESVSFF